MSREEDGAQTSQACGKLSVQGVGFVGPGGCLQCTCDVFRRCVQCTSLSPAMGSSTDQGGACGHCRAADAVMRVANAMTWIVLRLRMFGVAGGGRPSRTAADRACANLNVALHDMLGKIARAHLPRLYTHTVVTCQSGYFARELLHPAVGVLPLCVAMAIVGICDGKYIAPGLQQPLRTLLALLPPEKVAAEMTREVRGWLRGQVYRPFVALLLLVRRRDAKVAEWVDRACRHIRADAEARARLASCASPKDEALRACLAVSIVPQILTCWVTRTGRADFVGNRLSRADVDEAAAFFADVTRT
jgi:hypothetical protein